MDLFYVSIWFFCGFTAWLAYRAYHLHIRPEEGIETSSLLLGILMGLLLGPIMILVLIYRLISDYCKKNKNKSREYLFMENPTRNTQEIFEEIEYRKKIEEQNRPKNRYELIDI